MPVLSPNVDAMVDRRTLFGSAGRIELATERCDLNCAWCGFCRDRDLPGEALQLVWSKPPPSGTPVIRVRGGDPFRYGDLVAWVAWARSANAALCIEGPAAALAATDRRAVSARIVAAKPDAIAVVLPTADSERTEALTGVRWDPSQAIATLAQLAEVGIAIAVVFPVHPTTIGELAAVVRMVGARLAGVDLVLRRAPTARSNGRRLPTEAASDWSELDDLSRVLAALPDSLPGGVVLHFDPESGYAACMVHPDARRSDLFVGSDRGGGTRPLGSTCDPCAWAPHCAYRAHGAPPPSSRVRPLTAEDIYALDPQTRPRAAVPRRFHTDRASVGLPNLLCFAPWTTLSVCEPRFHPVPCALSWVDTDMTPDDIAAVTGASVEEERAREQITSVRLGAPWNVLDNERLSLMDLWNSPLLRLMRSEMTGGDKSSRCRTMCRVVMGVEERGIANFQRRDDELTPAVVANRRLLLDEIHAGKSVLAAKPLDLMIGVSAHCNISCGFCDGPRGQWGDLSDRRRDEILELLPTLMSFGVSGPGEPLMNRNFLQLLHHISDRAYTSLLLNLTTNGTLLTPELLARNGNVRWGSVRISLNAGSAETWERMTGKPYFDRVMTNLEALCALRERSARPFTITLSLVLGSVQMGDFSKFAQIVHDHRTAIIVEPMYDNLRNLSPWTVPEKLRALVDELTSVADNYVDTNPDIARAFRAVEQFARSRMAAGDYTVMKGH